MQFIVFVFYFWLIRAVSSSYVHKQHFVRGPFLSVVLLYTISDRKGRHFDGNDTLFTYLQKGYCVSFPIFFYLNHLLNLNYLNESTAQWLYSLPFCILKLLKSLPFFLFGRIPPVQSTIESTPPRGYPDVNSLPDQLCRNTFTTYK